MYTNIGMVNGKSQKFNSFFVELTVCLNRKDKLYVNGVECTIKNIFIDSSEVEEPFAGNEYPITVNKSIELPNKSSYKYKMEIL